MSTPQPGFSAKWDHTSMAQTQCS